MALSIEQQIHEIVSSLITSCVSIIEKIQVGCDNYSFLNCVKKATEETQRIFTFVKNIETPHTAEKEELLAETITVRNVVIKLIQQARTYHKNAQPNVPAATSQQLAPLRAELGAAIRQVKAAAQRFLQVETLQNIQQQSRVSSNPHEAGEDLFKRPEESAFKDKDIANLGVECLQAFSDMSYALQRREREKFANTTRTAINLVNQLVALQMESENVNKDNLMALRQNLVSLISHSKMYFVNPDDDYIKNTFAMFKGKVEKAVTSFIPEGYPINIKVHQEPAPTQFDDVEDTNFNLNAYSNHRENPDPPAVDRTKIAIHHSPSPPTRTVSTDVRGNPAIQKLIATPRRVASSPSLIPKPGINPTSGKDSTIIVEDEGEGLDTPQPGAGQINNSGRLDIKMNPKYRKRGRRSIPTEQIDLNQLREALKRADVEGIENSLEILDEGDETNERKSGASEGSNTVRSTSENQDNDHDLEQANSSSEGDSPSNLEDMPCVIRDEESADNEFTRSIVDLVKSTINPEYDHSEPDKLTKFEQNLRSRLLAYKKIVVLHQHQQQNAPRPRVAQSLTDSTGKPSYTAHPAPAPSTPYPRPGINNKPKQNPIIVTTKHDTFKFRLGKEKQILYRDLDYKPGPSGLTPRTKASKKISTAICSAIGILFQFVTDFTDNGKSYIRPSDKIDKMVLKNANDLKESLKTKLYESQRSLSDGIKDALDGVLTAHVDSPALEGTRQRIKENIIMLVDKKGTPYKVDETLFSQGQYIRFMIQSVLRSIYFKTEMLYFTSSHFLTVAREIVPTDSSHCFHLLCMGNIFVQILNDLLNEVETFCYIHSQDITKQPKKNPFLGGIAKKTKSDDSIWNEKEVLSNQLSKDDMYRAGTLNSLIIRMTEKPNSDFVGAFLAGHELFSDSKELWDKIEDRYNVPKGKKEAEETKFIKMRVANVVLQWLKVDLHTIDLSVLGTIDKFAEKNLKKDGFDEISTLIKKELDLMGRFAPFSEKEKERLSIGTVPKEVTIFGLQNLQPYEILLCGDSKTIAEQITFMEFDIYSRIGRSELISQKWSKEKYQILARNVSALVQRSDRLSHFVASSILFQKKLKDRAKVLVRCIRVAQALATLQNYNGLMGILMGLTLSSIQRLKFTWGKIPPKIDFMYKQLSLFQDPSNSFKNYRESIKQAGSSCVPYFTLYLSDLTFMDEGNPDWIEIDDTKLINFPKHQLVHRTIKTLQQYQVSPKFDLQPREPLYTFLYQTPGLDEKELYALSLEREPRGVQLRDLD